MNLTGINSDLFDIFIVEMSSNKLSAISYQLIH